MLKQKTNSRRGFTIIEVVLVLAIAGLIFLMVFLALPALQRSQRDTERRDKLGEFKTQITQYQSNSRGRVPDSMERWQSIVDDYMNLSRTEKGGFDIKTGTTWTNDDIPFLDPDGEPYYIAAFWDLKDMTAPKTNNFEGVNIAALTMTTGSDEIITTGLTWDDNKHQIYAFKHARCGEGSVIYQKEDSDRLVAFVTKLEGAGIYCGEN